MRRHGVLALLAAALAGAGPVRAQEPAVRSMLDSIRASFVAVTDSTTLIARERTRIAAARVDRDNPLIHMELGYIAFRLGELTGVRKRYQDAASEFQWAADLRPAWPYAWYNLGLSELSTGEAELIVLENIRQLLGQDALSMAVRSFARAIEADPSFSAALVDLANAAMRQRISPRLVVAQAALRQAAGTAAGRVPEVQLVRGRIERRLLANDSALTAFHRYIEVGGDSTIGDLELARTFGIESRIDSAVAAYAAGLARPVSDSARRELRRDLRWIATPPELAEFDALRPDSVGPWLRRFWLGRDVADGRRPGERLAEQFRRYQYAVQNFSLPSRHRGFDVAFAFRDTSQLEFDDRGVVYLRHGPPNDRAQFQGQGYEPNESWLYRGDPPDGDLIVHFVAISDIQDFRIVQSLLDICTRRLADAVQVASSAQVAAWRDCVLSRARLSTDYSRMANGGLQNWGAERAASMRAVHTATTTDSYHLRFDTDLRPVVSVFSVADSAMRPELHLVFAVPASRLHPQETDAGFTYPLALRMLVFDTGRHVVALLDTVRIFHSTVRLGPGAYLTEQMVMGVPAGRFRYSFVIEEPQTSSGDAVSNREIEIPPVAGGFAVSDVVLGREGSGLVWRRPEGAVPLNPLMRFPEGAEAVVWYEVYGLAQGAQVGTTIRVAGAGGRSVFHRLFGGGAGRAELSYITVTDAPGRSRVRQTLGLRGLSPGRYLLRLELTDPLSGVKVVRETPFEIGAGRSS